MERYDYRAAVKEDIREYLEESGVGYVAPDGDKRQELEDEMMLSDSVTGNGSGSYTLNTWVAEENLCHNMDLLEEAFEELGDRQAKLFAPEENDVMIRCYLLNSCLTEVLKDWNEEHPQA